MEEIAKLQSLNNLFKDLPKKFTSIRSLFEYQVSEICSLFERALAKAGKRELLV